jgi:aminopeptidase N
VASPNKTEAASRAALINVESYEIFIDLTASKDTVTSHTEVRFGCRKPGAATFADLTMATVTRVVLNGESLDPAEVLSGGRLRLAGLAGDNVLSVDAEFGYETDSRGLTRFTDPSDGAQYVLINSFPTSAPSVFCCFDQPDLRADVTLTVSAPAGWECMANAPVSARPGPGEAGVWRFGTAPRLQMYCLVLCAGPYVKVAEEEIPGLAGPIRLRVWCRPQLAAEPGLARIGGIISQSLRYYERLLGVACPYREFNLVFPPELAAIAMQVPSLTAANEPILQRAADPEDGFATRVLRHEVAHVWFGCMVEGRWWDDLWLGESLATYAGVLSGAEAMEGQSGWAWFGVVEKDVAYQADSVPGTPPVSSTVVEAADAMDRPYGILYVKGASVIRQLAALIGDDALLAGLRDYLTRYGGATATLDDVVACWSRASGRDLTGWAQDWLRTPGVNTLRPQLTLTADGTVGSFAVGQDPAPVLRTHRVQIGAYTAAGGPLRRTGLVSVEVSGQAAEVLELTGTRAPDAFVVNDGDLTYARIRFDAGSWRALAEVALDVGDPTTEAVLWNAAWDMTAIAAELPAAEFTDLVARRIATGALPPGLMRLLDHAVAAVDFYAPAAQRAGLRERLAAAAADAAGRAQPGSRVQRLLAGGFAASAHSDSQLDLLRAWLNGASLPDGMHLDLELRGKILGALAARGLVSDADVDALAAGDPAAGAQRRATLQARRPDPAAKETAWAAALAPSQSIHLARAHAEGIWVPGQEDLMAPYAARYFSEALPAVEEHRRKIAGRLGKLLFPVTLATQDTIAATEAAMEDGGYSEPVRLVLAEARLTAQRMLAARSRA